MEIIENRIYRNATRVTIEYMGSTIIDDWIQDSVIPWIVRESKLWDDLLIILGNSELKESKDILNKKDIISKIYLSLQVLKIKNSA